MNIEQILEKLDEEAREHDKYEYGLPLYNDYFKNYAVSLLENFQKDNLDKIKELEEQIERYKNPLSHNVLSTTYKKGDRVIHNFTSPQIGTVLHDSNDVNEEVLVQWSGETEGVTMFFSEIKMFPQHK